jgi:hypothetical protein
MPRASHQKLAMSGLPERLAQIGPTLYSHAQRTPNGIEVRLRQTDADLTQHHRPASVKTRSCQSRAGERVVQDDERLAVVMCRHPGFDCFQTRIASVLGGLPRRRTQSGFHLGQSGFHEQLLKALEIQEPQPIGGQDHQRLVVVEYTQQCSDRWRMKEPFPKTVGHVPGEQVIASVRSRQPKRNLSARPFFNWEYPNGTHRQSAVEDSICDIVCLRTPQTYSHLARCIEGVAAENYFTCGRCAAAR